MIAENTYESEQGRTAIVRVKVSGSVLAEERRARPAQQPQDDIILQDDGVVCIVANNRKVQSKCLGP